MRITTALITVTLVSLYAGSPCAGESELITAIKNNDVERVKALLAPGSEYEFDICEENMLLAEAAKNGYTEIVNILLRSGLDINTIDGSLSKLTPLMWAAFNGHTDTIETLLASGADINMNGGYYSDSNAFEMAITGGHIETVELFMNLGANIHQTNDIGTTLLMKAVYCGHIDIIKLLISNGANVNVSNRTFYHPPLGAAADKNRVDIMKVLIEAGANIDVINKDGYTPLLTAAYQGSKDAAQLLIDSGADIYHTNNRRESALDIAEKKGHNEIVEMLKAAGADKDKLKTTRRLRTIQVWTDAEIQQWEGDSGGKFPGDLKPLH